MKITCNMKADETTIMDKEGKVGRKVAEGWVEIEDCFRFPVIVRTYQDKETKKEKMFLSYPQRKTRNGYEDIIAPTDYQIRKEIEECVLSEVTNCITKSVSTTPITDVKVKLSQSDDNPSLRGVASATLAGGIVLNGITIRKDKDGLKVQMPQYMSDGVWHDYVSATNVIIRADIEQEVLHAYKKEKRKNIVTPVERFVAMYEERNPEGMLESLKQADLKIENAVFKDGKLCDQTVHFSDEEYKILFHFETINEEKQKFVQRIRAVMEHGNKRTKMTFTNLVAQNEEDANKNYKLALDLWKYSTNQKDIKPHEMIPDEEKTQEMNKKETTPDLAKTDAKESEKTYTMEQLLEAYKTGNSQEMLKILSTFEMRLQEAIFTTNGNAIKVQSAEYQENDYKVELRFSNEWNPIQVVQPEQALHQSISAYLYQNNQIFGICKLKDLKSKSLKNMEKNYEELKEEWMNLLHVETIEFPGKKQTMNAAPDVKPVLSAPRH